MLKVVIADDEARVCRLVQMLGDWDALDMLVSGTASNGLEALELVEMLRPDILVTDIRMPGCDGLELIERAKKISPDLEIIIISGYAQFEYAQTAISHGVSGYLLKPIKKEALMTALEKSSANCKKREASSVTMENLKNKSQHMHWHRMMEDLVSGKLADLKSEILRDEYEFPSSEGYLQLFIIKLDYDPKNFDAKSFMIASQKSEEVFKSTILPLCSAGFVTFIRSAGYGLIRFDTDKKEEIRRSLRNFMNQMQAQHSFFKPVEVSLACGAPTKSAADLPESLKKTQLALSQRLLDGNRRLLETVPPASFLHTQHILEKYNRAISHAVDSLNIEEADKAVDELYTGATNAEGPSGFEILDLVLSAGNMFSLLIHAGEKGIPTNHFDRDLETCGTLDQLFDTLRRYQRQLINNRLSQKESEAIRPIRLAKQYIQQHFHEPITLDDVCGATGFSVSYFSTMFKKETGEGFSKYLTRVRIEEAKSLLQSTNLSIAEVCEKVGYSDIKHFTITFKKLTSLNPGQYRRLYG